MAVDPVTVTIWLPGLPVALARPRFKMVGGHAAVFDSQKDKKNAWRYAALAALRQEAATRELEAGKRLLRLAQANAFEVTIVFYHLKTPRSLVVKNDLGEMAHCQKPDLDNLIKFVLDAGNGLLWHDDSAIHTIQAKKVLSQEHTGTHLTIRAMEATEPPPPKKPKKSILEKPGIGKPPRKTWKTANYDLSN